MKPIPPAANITNGDPSRLDRIEQILKATYGMPAWHSSAPPIDELIQTILSQHTSDTNSERAFASLRERFPTWTAVRDAPTTQVADAIRSGGLAAQKAPRIQAVLEHVLAAPDGYTADALRSLPLMDAQNRLTSLPGVGPKTAACVLLFSLGMPAMPVDTHVHRVIRRLGLVPSAADAPTTQQVLEAQVGPDRGRVYALHLNLIRHGRIVCHARRPCCEVCPLTGECAYYARMQAGIVAESAAVTAEGKAL